MLTITSGSTLKTENQYPEPNSGSHKDTTDHPTDLIHTTTNTSGKETKFGSITILDVGL
jgi:hypothetical protein